MTKLPAPDLPPWLARLVPFERYMLDVGGYRMHVMEAGDPKGAPVVMLHGNPTWGFLYRRVVDALADAPARLILPDLIGLGCSDKPSDAAEHTIERHSRWFGAMLDALSLERIVFVGQDWGGPIGLHALAERTDLTHSMVILNTVVGPPKPGFKATAFHRFARAPLVSDVAFRVLGFPQIALDRAQGDRDSIRGEVARAYRWPLRHLRDRVAPLALARMVPDSQHHASIEPLRRVQQYADSFRGPVSIVWGDRDPVLGRVRSFIERVFPQAEVTRTQAGHFLQEEVPAEIASAIRRCVTLRDAPAG